MNENKFSQHAVDISLRLLLLLGVLYWCFEIVSPFIMPVLWAIIIAVACYPIQQFFEKRIHLKPKAAAIVVTLLLLSFLLVPAILFFSSATKVIFEWKTNLEQGKIDLPKIPEFIEKLPFVGEKLHELIDNFNENMEAFILSHQSQLLDTGKSILQFILGTGLNLLQVIFSIILAGVMLGMGERAKFSEALSIRLIGKNGPSYVSLSVQTIRNVVKGVLGVAAIQAILAGIGLGLSGIPYASVWALLCLVLAIVQIGPGIILVGASIYLFETESTLFATLWTIYFGSIAFSDNLLKPILFSKGAQVPMPVIFIGVIGGFMLSGFIGLFTGAIILSIGYKLFWFWFEHNREIIDPKVVD